MLVNRKHGYVYVHVYKVAGQSVKLALRRYHYRYLPGLRTPIAHLVELPMAYSFRPLDAHATAVQIRDMLGPEEYNKLFSFSFVRNPWDWQVSLYHFIQKNKLNYQRRMVSEMSFPDYIKWRVEEDCHLQSEFVVDRHGETIVDFVGKYENLSDDFAQICSKIGVDASLPHVNASEHAAFRSYYDDHTAALIGEAFKEDVERFGYSFEP